MIGWKPKSANTDIASVRYRCLLPMHVLRRRGIEIELFDESNISAYTDVIFSKCYSEESQLQAIRLRNQGARIILDICDNHFYNPYGLPAYEKAKTDLLKMLELADEVTCSTDVLADTVQVEADLKQKPWVIDDPVETAAGNIKSEVAAAYSGLIKKLLRKDAGRLQLLWFGVHGSPNAEGGMADLKRIEKHLYSLNEHVSADVIVCSNNVAKYRELIAPLDFPSSYVEWRQKSFPRLLKESSAVIIPVSQNPFTRCKTHNRLSLALSHGKPVIADSIPSYSQLKEFCVLDDWEAGLMELNSSPKTAIQRAERGRDFVTNKYSVEAIADEWQKLLSKPLIKRY